LISASATTLWDGYTMTTTGKRDVIVYNYVDSAVPALARMAAKRETGYKSLGYAIDSR
jgi:hypothetical protein